MSEPSTVRFFTSAALRAHEEVPGEIVQWLPRWIAVEYDGTRPITGVWHSADGKRRVCWYSDEQTNKLVEAHAERYGAEPFWIVDLAGMAERRVAVLECDAAGRLEFRRTWDFDEWNMPKREDARSADGALIVARTYECVETGIVVGATEHRTGQGDLELEPPITFPIPELGGEPLPCGQSIGVGGPRLIESITQNQFQGRAFAAYRDGTTWRRGIATIATRMSSWPPPVRSAIDFTGDHVAPLVIDGRLVPGWTGNYPFLGVVEALPEGRSLEEVVSDRPLSLKSALDIVIEVAEIAERAHLRGHELGGIRPELVCVRPHESTWALVGIIHRGASVIGATYCGEGHCLPPVFPYDFSSATDVQGLAQLLWFALTGDHPFVSRKDFGERKAWRDLEHGKARPQPWNGPAVLGPLMERSFLEPSESVSFGPFVAELRALREGTL